jgi:hypothetical protein
MDDFGYDVFSDDVIVVWYSASLFRLKKKKRIGLHYFDPAHFIHFFYQTPFYSFILSAHSFLHVLFFSTFILFLKRFWKQWLSLIKFFL